MLDYHIHYLRYLNNEIDESEEVKLKILTQSGLSIPAKMKVKRYVGEVAQDGYFEILTFLIFDVDFEYLLKNVCHASPRDYE